MHQHRFGVLYTAYRSEVYAASILAHSEVPVKRGLLWLSQVIARRLDQDRIPVSSRTRFTDCLAVSRAPELLLNIRHQQSAICSIDELVPREKKPSLEKGDLLRASRRPVRHAAQDAPIKRRSASYAHLAIQHAQTPISKITDKRPGPWKSGGTKSYGRTLRRARRASD